MAQSMRAGPGAACWNWTRRDLTLRDVDRLMTAGQERLAAFQENGRFRLREDSEWSMARVRIFATSGSPMVQTMERGEFSSASRPYWQ